MPKILLAFFFLPLLSFAQDSTLTSCINSNAIFFKDDDLNTFIKNNIVNLPEGDFYMISQIHNSKIDIPLEQELLFELHKQGVYYDISEYPHSAFFLVNEYLKSGDTAFLKLLSEKAPFQFIKNVYRFNQNFSVDKQIKFFGIDYELYNFDRGKHYKNSLVYIFTQRKEAILKTDFYPLYELLKNTEVTNIKELTNIHKKLQLLLSKYEDDLPNIFSNYISDISLILSAPTKYKSIPTRDKWLFERFKTVHKIVAKINNHPKFIASFGASHVKERNSKNITHKLKAFYESPVKNKVVIIGTQYFNGSGGIIEAGSYESAGILDLTVSKDYLQSMSNTFTNKTENVSLLKQDKLFCLGKISKGLDWLFLINKQIWVKYWKWE